MAMRDAGVRLKVEGEKEFRSAISGINAVLKVMDAQLGEISSEFAANAGSMQNARAQVLKLNETLDKLREKQKTIKQALDNAKKALEQYTDEFEAAKKAAEDHAKAMKRVAETLEEGSEEYQKMAEKQEKLDAAVSAAASGMKAAERATNSWTIELSKTNMAIDKTSAQLKTVEDGMNGVADGADEAAEASEKMGMSVTQSVDAVSNAVASARLEELFDGLKESLKDSAEAAIKWESAFAGVVKTVDADEWQLEEINAGLRDMAMTIPVTAEELAAIAENAGQLGIAAGDVLQFTETVANLAATTNMTSEQSAVQFARFANITKMTADEYGRLGAVVVDLGNNMAATETEILDMGMRLAAAGNAAGLAKPEILGIAAALSSVGLEAEMGGSAFSKAIKQIQVSVETNAPVLEDYAEVAGMTGEAFANLWSTNTASAISQFIAGIGDVDRQGQSIISTLADLGMTEIRLSDTMGRLAGNAELLESAIARGNRAWVENTALVNEANIRYETTESKITLLNNAVEELRIVFGEKLKPALGEGVEGLTDTTQAITELVRESDALVPAVTGVTAALGTFAGVAAVGTAIKTVLPAIASFVTLGGGVVGVVAGVGAAVAGLVTGLAVYKAAQDEANDKMREYRESAEKLTETAEEQKKAYQSATDGIQREEEALISLVQELDVLIDKEQKTASDKAEIQEIVKQLNESLPGLALSYDELSNSLNKSASEMELWIEQAILLDKQQAELANMKSAKESLANAEEEMKKIREAYRESAERVVEYKGRLDELREANEKLDWETQAEEIGKNSTEMAELNDLIAEEKRLQEGLWETYATVRKVRDEAYAGVERAKKLYDEYGDSIETASENQKKAAGTALALAGAYETVAEETSALEEELSALEKEYEEASAGIEELGDALVEALKKQTEKARDNALADLDSQIEGVKEKLEEETAAYEAAYTEREGFIERLTETALGGLQEQIELLNEITAESQGLLDELEKKADLQDQIGKISGFQLDIDSATEAERLLGGFGGAFGHTLEIYDGMAERAMDEMGAKLAELGDGYKVIFDQYKEDVDYVAGRYAAEISSAGEEVIRLNAELEKLKSEAAGKANYGDDKDLKKEYENLLDDIEDMEKDIEKAEEKAAERRIELEEEAAGRQTAIRLQMYLDMLEAASEATDEEKRLAEERDAVAEKYDQLRAEASAEEDSENKIAELNAQQEREEAEYTRRIAEEVGGRYDKVYDIIVGFLGEELELNEEQYDALLKLTENSNSEQADAARALLNFKRENMADTLELVQEHADKVTETQKDALETEAKEVQGAQKSLLDQYRTYYDELAKEAENEAEREVARLQAERKITQDEYKGLLEDKALFEKAKKEMTQKSSEEQIALLETYTPEWRTAGQNWADALTGGVGENIGEIQTILDTTVSAALEKLNSLRGKIDAVKGEIAGAEESAADLRLIEQYQTKIAKLYEDKRKMEEEGGNTNGISRTIANLEERLDGLIAEAKADGWQWAQGLAEGMLSGKAEVEEAAAELAQTMDEATREEAEIHSPSRKGVRIGEFFTKGIAIGMEDKLELIRQAAARISEEMAALNGGAGDEIRTRALIQRSVTAEVQTPELIRALQGLEIKSIGYHQTNNFNGQTSPYMAARAVENAIRRALT